jgi:hypothetical protein
MPPPRYLQQISLKGYKSIDSLESLPLNAGLNVLIGANGSGKSNFIRFFDLLRNIADATKGLQNYVAQHGGADAFLFRGMKITPEFQAKLAFGSNRYEFTLKAADEPLAPLGKLLEESAILPAYMKMLAANFKADAVLLSAASVRSPLPAGTLTSNKLFASIPWNNPLVILQLNEDQLAKASAISGHVVLRKQSLPSPARLVTSLFFARILQDQLGLPDTALETIPDSLEFENAKAMVKAQPAALANASIPEGWSYVPAP